ncbi:MAG: DMT family transporter [Paludibacteraceae bacterium]|nr:DMT family transporter [Paludibacteraceae bacterium]
MNNRTKGYLFGIFGAAAYGLNPLFTLPLYADSVNPLSALLFRYGLAAPLLALLMVARRMSFRIDRHELPALIVLGIMMALSSLTLFVSYTYMDAGIASTLLFVYPILTAVLMKVGYQERMNWKVAVSMLLALAGILLLYYQGKGLHLDATGVLLVFVSALTYAIYLIGVKHSCLVRMPTLKMNFYVLVVSTALFVVCLLFFGPLTLPQHGYLWMDALALALFPTCVSFLFTTLAVHRIGSTETSILGALEPLTAVVIGILVFHEAFTFRNACGIALILLSVCVVVWQGKRLQTPS